MAFLSFEMSRGNTYGLRCNENVGFTLHHLAPITAQDPVFLCRVMDMGTQWGDMGVEGGYGEGRDLWRTAAPDCKK